MSVSRQFLPTLQNGQKSNKSKGCKRKNVRHLLLHSVLFIVLQKKSLCALVKIDFIYGFTSLMPLDIFSYSHVNKLAIKAS